jgi:hypothetical protein
MRNPTLGVLILYAVLENLVYRARSKLHGFAEKYFGLFWSTGTSQNRKFQYSMTKTGLEFGISDTLILQQTGRKWER